ncbi:helix-turn-helix transcriptional regulator [Flaviaesturariibacter amylovorans]|uniref:HTH cro/C1-type domain-containing protein n=1 Tax=Flaviaesturariibacter amylovorans TaxID=1084520 RepID=A0ABP8H6I5_9BACT
MDDRFTLEKKAFGIRLRQIRESKGLSQLDLEVQSNINRTEISRIENGQKNIELATIVKLAIALNVEIKSFFEEHLPERFMLNP